MFKNHHGKSLPAPIYQSDLRENRLNFYQSKNKAFKNSKKGTEKIESFPARDYVMQLIFLGTLMLFSMALVAGYAPGV